MAAARRSSTPIAASARARCVPIYNALDPATHHPVPPDAALRRRPVFLANRLPDREARVEEFFLRPRRARCRESRFLIGGTGWDDKRDAAATSRHSAMC